VATGTGLLILLPLIKY